MMNGVHRYTDVYAGGGSPSLPTSTQMSSRSSLRRSVRTPPPGGRTSTHRGREGEDVFHHSDTLPPNAVGRERGRRPLETISDGDDYHSPYVDPLSVENSYDNGRRKVDLRVRIEGVRDLVPITRVLHPPPLTFVVVQTAYGRGKTPIMHQNANPSFNDEFVFDISNPDTEEVTVTVVAITNTGRKKLGQCALSVFNLMQGVERRLWVALVRHPGTERAYECGAILVSLYSDTLATNIYSSPSKEKEFRENLRVLLQKDAPEELHRLEWYVGRCVDDYDGAYAALVDQYHKPQCEPAAFQLTIHSVYNLTKGNGTPTTRETCYVKISSSRSNKVTKMVPYHRRALFNETFDMMIDNPKVGTISLAVFSANHKFGECLVSLSNLRPRVPKERTHNIVYAAGTGDACYCGTIRIVLRSINYGTDSPISDKEDERRRVRVRNYLWTYLRDDLHRLDPIVASIDNTDSFIHNLEKEYGPEPLQHVLRLRIQNFRQDQKGDEYKTYSVVARMGPEIYRTSGARFSQDFIFNDETMIPVCMPEKDEFVLIILEEASANDVEVGRVVISLKNIVHDIVFKLPLKVYEKALTIDAKAVGTLFIEGVLYGFGLDEKALSDSKRNYFCQRLEALFSRYDPSQLHRIEYYLGEYVGKEERLMKDLTDKYGPETGTAPMRVRVASIHDFVPTCLCYVKVYLDDQLILRTKHLSAERSMMFDISMRNEKTVPIADPLHSMLKFKVVEYRRFRSSRLLGISEMSLKSMVRDEPNTYSLPIYDETSQEEIGTLVVEAQSPGFVKGIVTEYEKPPNGTGGSVLEDVTRDVTSLVRKYCPQQIPRVQPLIAQSSSLKDAHRELRIKFASEAIAFTFYVHVDKINMVQEEDKKALEDGQISLSASFLQEEVRSYLKVTWPDRIDTRKCFPEMRMDIVFPRGSGSTAVNAALEIIVHGVPRMGTQGSFNGSRRSTVMSSNRVILPEKEVARIALSLRALLTKKMYPLGEAVTLPIIRSYLRPGATQCIMGKVGTDSDIIMGEITLRITIPAFERIPPRLRFPPAVTQRFHSGYVRYYEKRIASFYRVYDPSSLRDFHFTLYERDVASGRWPLSLHNWLLSLIKRHGPEPTICFGPPPKLPFDPEVEEAGSVGENARGGMFSSTDGKDVRSPSARRSRRRVNHSRVM